MLNGRFWPSDSYGQPGRHRSLPARLCIGSRPSGTSVGNPPSVCWPCTPISRHGGISYSVNVPKTQQHGRYSSLQVEKATNCGKQNGDGASPQVGGHRDFVGVVRQARGVAVAASPGFTSVPERWRGAIRDGHTTQVTVKSTGLNDQTEDMIHFTCEASVKYRTFIH